MKKLLPVLLLVIASPAFSQWGGGLKAGLNIANFIGEDADGADPRIGYHIGGYMTKSITESFSFQPELIVSSVGTKTEESGYDPDFLGDYSIKATIILTYLSAPIMFTYNISDKVNLQAGPQLSYLMAAKTKYDIESDLITDSGSEGVKDQFKAIDFGLNFGLGVNFGVVNASARYSLGLTEIPDESANLKNSVIQISLGYKIEKK